MDSIGEFSRISSLSIRPLRFYHDKRLPTPAYVDSGAGYRNYDGPVIEKARAGVALRELGFSLKEIVELLGEDDGDVLDYLERQRM